MTTMIKKYMYDFLPGDLIYCGKRVNHEHIDVIATCDYVKIFNKTTWYNDMPWHLRWVLFVTFLDKKNLHMHSKYVRAFTSLGEIEFYCRGKSDLYDVISYQEKL